MTRQAPYPLVAALLVALLAAPPVQAAQGGQDWGQQRQFAPHERGQYERQYQPQQPPQRRHDADPQGPQYPQRLSPDERRQLRRDLRDAGRDVYPQRRDWRR